MYDLKMALISSALHLLELVVLLGAVWFVLSFFGVDSESAKVLIGLAVSGLVKFSRSFEGIPLPEYVNPE